MSNVPENLGETSALRPSSSQNMGLVHVDCLLIVGSSCLQVDPISPSFMWFSSHLHYHLPQSPALEIKRYFAEVGITILCSNSILYAMVLPFLLWLWEYIVKWSIVPKFLKFLVPHTKFHNILPEDGSKYIQKNDFCTQNFARGILISCAITVWAQAFCLEYFYTL